LYLLLRRSNRLARVLAAGAVATIVLGWGIGQWDYVLPTSLTVAQAAAPSGTITAVLVATALAVALLGPSFVLLYTLDQRSLLPAEGATDQASTGS
jgi:cytochrome d ubiquinol oxidase subunit II